MVDLLFIGLLKTLFSIHTGEGLFMLCITKNFGPRFANFWFLCTGFYCNFIAESALRSVDMFSRQCSSPWAWTER